MFRKSLILAAGVLAAVPALAQAPDAAAARNSANWNALAKLYPPRAIAAREQGIVGFVVTLDSMGHPTQCRVTHSSGYPRLDQETCQLITLHAVFKPAAGLSGSQVSTHEGVVNWKLPNGAAAGTAPTAIKVAEAPEKVICKRVKKTGSLVSTERVCLSKTEWDRASAQSREPWDEMQGRKGMTSGN